MFNAPHAGAHPTKLYFKTLNRCSLIQQENIHWWHVWLFMSRHTANTVYLPEWNRCIKKKQKNSSLSRPLTDVIYMFIFSQRTTFTVAEDGNDDNVWIKLHFTKRLLCFFLETVWLKGTWLDLMSAVTHSETGILYSFAVSVRVSVTLVQTEISQGILSWTDAARSPSSEKLPKRSTLKAAYYNPQKRVSLGCDL